ncbi:MAG: DUF2452 domain-containing protein [Halioglobus sp.]|nr:DUF2452 domain-containing protein [Halioglobus sp.]
MNKKNPNPQGKGAVPVLRDWSTMQPAAVGSKDAATFLRDYCISSLVLAARFRFKPVPGKDYFLYVGEGDWMLSLIGPHEWGTRRPGAFLGRCRLRMDMTWAIETSTNGETESLALERAQAFVAGFVDSLQGQAAVEDSLPYYISHLPYYQRLLATALASSLQQTLALCEQGGERLLADAGEWLAAGGAGALLGVGLARNHQQQAADAPAEFSHR